MWTTTAGRRDRTEASPHTAISPAPRTGTCRISEKAGVLGGWSEVLADPTRLQLYGLIATREEVWDCELAERSGISRPTVSHHLEVLHRAGLLDRDTRRHRVYYRLGVLAGRALAVGSLPGRR